MSLEHDSRARFQRVRKPKSKGKYGRLKPAGTIFDPQLAVYEHQRSLRVQQSLRTRTHSAGSR